MQMTRNWQESFDRLERSRREEQRLREEEERQIRLAEAAYERASLQGTGAETAASVESGSFMLKEAPGAGSDGSAGRAEASCQAAICQAETGQAAKARSEDCQAESRKVSPAQARRAAAQGCCRPTSDHQATYQGAKAGVAAKGRKPCARTDHRSTTRRYAAGNRLAARRCACCARTLADHAAAAQRLAGALQQARPVRPDRIVAAARRPPSETARSPAPRLAPARHRA